MRDYLMFLAALLVIGVWATNSHADDESLRKASEAAKAKAKEYRGVVVPEHLKNGGGENAAARAAYDATQAPEFKARVEAEKKRLSEGVMDTAEFGVLYSDLAVDEKQSGWDGAAPVLAADERIYIFISSSMPETTLRAYAASIDKLGDRNIVMVLRGFVGGAKTLLPTASFISKILFKDPSCRTNGCAIYRAEVIIDPELYRRYKPDVVPAVVYAKGVRPFDPARSEGNKENTPDASNSWMIYGDASLSHALREIERSAKTGKLEKIAKATGS